VAKSLPNDNTEKAYLREKKKHGAVTKQKARHRRWPRRRRRSRQRKMMRTKAKARPNLKLTPRSEAKEQDATQVNHQRVLLQRK
jgi:hypothetical protein